MGNPDRRHIEDGAKVYGQARSAGVIEPGGVDENYVGYRAERSDDRGEERTLAESEEARRVRGRRPLRQHSLVFDVRRSARTCNSCGSEHVVGTPVRQPFSADGARAGPPGDRRSPGHVAALPAIGLCLGEGDETAADEWGSRRLPRRGGEYRFGVLCQCDLEPNELLACLRPWRHRLQHSDTIAPWRTGSRTALGAVRFRQETGVV